MDRRTFLKTSTAAAVSQAFPVSLSAATEWRTYETVTRVELQWPKGVSRAWVPLGLAGDSDWHQSIGSAWTGNASQAQVARDGKYGVSMSRRMARQRGQPGHRGHQPRHDTRPRGGDRKSVV